MENSERDCFTFFKSFYFAIDSISDENNQLRLYKAIIE